MVRWVEQDSNKHRQYEETLLPAPPRDTSHVTLAVESVAPLPEAPTRLRWRNIGRCVDTSRMEWPLTQATKEGGALLLCYCFRLAAAARVHPPLCLASSGGRPSLADPLSRDLPASFLLRFAWHHLTNTKACECDYELWIIKQLSLQEYKRNEWL